MIFRPRVEVPPDARANWERGVTFSCHNLSDCPLFSDEEIVALLDGAPKQNVFAFSMGTDPELHEENRFAVHDGLSGAALFRAVQNGRLWLNVTQLGAFAPRFTDVVGQLYDQLAAQVPNFNPRVTSVTLLVSSPQALVYYHVDGPANLLWHVRGEKRIFVYPPEEPYIRRSDLEDIFAGAAHEYLPYRREFESAASEHQIAPGSVVGWPPNAPHRVTNGESINLSLSTEHFTPAHRRKARVYQANRLLRVGLGWRGASTRASGAGAWTKQGLLAVATRLSRSRPAASERYTPALRVDPDAPGGVRPL
jgi:hypothetical protein